jgi:hypothetical protein
MDGFGWRESEVGQKGKRKPTPMSELVPVEIPDAEHDLVIERAAAIDVAKAFGKVCVCGCRASPGGGLAGCGMCLRAPARSASWPSSWWSWISRR